MKKLGTYACPVCGYDKPHSHTPEELRDRPYVDGAWQAFREQIRSLAGFCGLLGDVIEPGVQWLPCCEADMPHLLPKKAVPAWSLWKKAWIEARRQMMNVEEPHDA